MATDVTLPELGENIEAGDVAAVLVNPGDRVEKDAPLLELETDKAVVEVPSPEAGVVTAILVEAGDTINVGDTIASLEPDGAGAAPQPEDHPLRRQPRRLNSRRPRNRRRPPRRAACSPRPPE